MKHPRTWTDECGNERGHELIDAYEQAMIDKAESDRQDYPEEETENETHTETEN